VHASRPMRAGAGAPTEATWVALMGLDTACRQYGVPAYVVSDRGGAYPANAFEAVWTRRPSRHETLVSTPGASDLHGRDTHVTMQRRLDDDQCAWARPPAALEERHQAFLQTSNTTAHQGLLQERRLPPLPSRAWDRPQADSTPPRTSPATARRPCSLGPPTARAVAPGSAITARWKRGSPRRRCCWGCTASRDGPRVSLGCAPRITAATMGHTKTSELSARGSCTAPGLPRSRPR
jgi:hypothetical protein